MLNVKKILTDICKALLVEQDTGTADSSISTANTKTCKVTKLGDIVFLNLALAYNDDTTAIPMSTTLFTIPAKYRPSSGLAIPAVIFRTGSNIDLISLISIGTDGTIKQNIGGTVGQIYVSTSYKV